MRIAPRYTAVIAALLGFAALPAAAEITPAEGMDIYILGEVHDNPAHHAEQARLMALIAPGAVVWEMMSPDQSDALTGVDRSDATATEAALGWAAAGWPDFAMYHPILLAAGDVPQIGAAAAREDLTAVMRQGLSAVLGNQAVADWGLGPLPLQDQSARESDQRAAHCNALPEDLLPGMVDAQRYRDWAMASAAVTAVQAGQTPVVIITGTGHARSDQGIPALIRAAQPDLRVWSLGQVEDDPGPDAPFDAVNQTAPTPRKDPCAAFASPADGN
ncbi:MAG: ChaN family lipoprotein [Paracoccaceae bacterium]